MSDQRVHVLRSAIKRYIELGFVIHPCCPPTHDCDSPGKIPYDAVGGHHAFGWQNHTQYTLEQWDYFLKCEPEINIGVLTGSPSGLLFIDIDDQEAEDEYCRLTRESIDQGKDRARNCWVFETGKGKRFIFRNTDPSPSFKIPAGTGHYIEVLGDGRQSVLPPSIHPTGKQYRWVANFAPRDRKLDSSPSWIIGGFSGSGNTPEDGSIDGSRIEWARIVEAGVGEGDRNNQMTRLCGRLLSPAPLSHEEAWFWFKLYNRTMVDPPLAERELEKIFRSISRRETGSEAKIREIMVEFNVSRKHAQTILESGGWDG